MIIKAVNNLECCAEACGSVAQPAYLRLRFEQQQQNIGCTPEGRDIWPLLISALYILAIMTNIRLTPIAEVRKQDL